jgi:hypothetical protein
MSSFAKVPLEHQQSIADGRLLCENCKKLNLTDLFETDKRAPEPDGDWYQEINSLQHMQKHTLCSMCVLLSLIIRYSDHSKVSQTSYKRKSDALYLEPRRNESALCGIYFQYKFEKLFASCLHLETAKKIFHDKLVLVSEGDRNTECDRPLYAILSPVEEYVNFTTIKTWLQSCSTNHAEFCVDRKVISTDELFLKTQRVIDVQTRRVIPKQLAEICYATLTYVWGIEFAQEVATAHLSQDLPKNLHRTFSDAIVVCKKLDIAFLWIDSYCIAQSDQAEKAAQIRNMDIIYRGSYLTIVAIEGDDPTYGLPGVSIARRHPYYGRTFECAGSKLAIVPGFVGPTQIWNTRAWTLQEALLSSRLLVFNQNYLSFYCCGDARREDFTHAHETSIMRGEKWKSLTDWEPNLGSPFTNAFRTGSFAMRDYCELVTLYSSRSLSNATDALNAVIGLLQHWTRVDGVQFIAGIPKPVFSDALIWMGSNYITRGHPYLPTWCWAAWQGNLSYSTISSGSTAAAEKSFRNRYNFKFKRCTDPLNTRMVSWYHSGSIGFGNMIELEVTIDVSEYTQTSQRLLITSQVAHFQMSAMTRDAYDIWRSKFKNSLNGRKVNDASEVQDKFVLIEDGQTLLMALGDGNGLIELPKDVSEYQKAELRIKGAEFLLLKFWYKLHPVEEPSSYKVWALLIGRRGNVAHRLGCMEIYPEVWEMGSPKIETVILE